MKIFERDEKANFVDDNNVLVGFDNWQLCCESFGYFLSRKVPTKIDEGAEDINTDGFNFDTSFFREVPPAEECLDAGGMAVFRLTKGAEEIFLTLHNTHNGYYSHGFSMDVGGKRIFGGGL